MKSKQIEGFAFTLKNDYAFKRILGVEENKPLLQDFLECVLDLEHDEIEGLELLDKELKKDHAEDRTGILDIQVRLRNGMLIDSSYHVCFPTKPCAPKCSPWSAVKTIKVLSYKLFVFKYCMILPNCSSSPVIAP